MTQYYFYNADTESDGDLGYSANWWLDDAHTKSANRSPTSGDAATLLSNATSGWCYASSVTVPLNVKFGSAANTTGDLIVSQMNDYLGDGSPESCNRISIDGGKTFYGPTRYWFKAASASANLNTTDGWFIDSGLNWQASQIPKTRDIAIILAPSVAGCTVSDSFACGILFNLSGKVGWSNFMFTGAMYDNPANLLSCTFNGPYNARNLYCAQKLHFAEFNGPAYLTGTIGQSRPLTIPAPTPASAMFTFNGDVAMDATNLFIDPSLPSYVFGKGYRFSLDYGLTWIDQRGLPTYASVNDVRFGVNRGDGKLGKCYVPIPAQVQKGVLVDASGVGSLAINGDLTASGIQLACEGAIDAKQAMLKKIVQQAINNKKLAIAKAAAKQRR